MAKKEIQEVLGKNVQFFNGTNRLAVHLKEVLKEKNLLEEKEKKGKIEFVDSSHLKQKEERFYQFLRRKEEKENENFKK